MESSPVWRIEMFGGLQAVREPLGAERFRSRKAGLLLARLALRPGLQPREVLIDLLWPGSEPHLGRNSLSSALSSLRRQLEAQLPEGTLFTTNRASVGLNPPAFSTDVQEFEAALRQAASSSHEEEHVEALARAVEIYKGELLPGFYDEWVQVEARRREEEFAAALARLLEALEARGHFERALEFARRGVAACPAQEEWHLALMRGHAALEQPEAALRQFQHLKKILKRARNEEPSDAAHRLARTLKKATARGSAPRNSVRDDAPQVLAGAEATLAAPLAGVLSLLLLDWPLHEGERALLASEMERRGGIAQRQAAGKALWAFARASEALAAAGAVGALGLSAPLRVAVATGDAVGHKGEHGGELLRRAEKMLLAAHPGQAVCGEATAAVAAGAQESGASPVALRELGRYRLGAGRVERLFQIGGAAPAGEVREVFPPLKAAREHAGSLPLTLTRFFGREAEIQEVRQVLEEGTRLVTITGTGGGGKTRLTIEAAHALGEAWQGAVWFVPLADIRDAGLIFSAIRDALRLPILPSAAPREQLIEALSWQPSLLVLDNLEQLAQEGADRVAELLQSAPRLSLLVTSRRTLGLPGEVEIALSPLPTPPAGSLSAAELQEFAGVALFVDRARLARPDFALSERNAPSLAALCRRLEGIPLALEMAAARVQVLSPAAILEKIDVQPGFLEARGRGVPERHRTLRAAIAWSYDLLEPPMQRFFARLSVFRGGWTEDAAAEVCEEPDALELLSRLREFSLVVAEERAGETRFRMLESLHLFAASLLSAEEREALAQRHLKYFERRAREANIFEAGALDAEQENWRAALEEALRSAARRGEDVERAARLVESLLPLWELRGHYAEGTAWGEQVLAHQGVPLLLRARLLCLLGEMWRHASDFNAASDRARQSLQLFEEAGDVGGMADALNVLGRVAIMTGEMEQARALFERGLGQSRTLGDKRRVLQSLINLCWLYINSPAPMSYAATIEESLALAREIGDERGTATMLTILGLLFLGQEQHEAARISLEEALRQCEQNGQHWEMTVALGSLGKVAAAQGDFERAHALMARCLRLYRAAGSQWETSIVLKDIALLRLEQGQPHNAATLLGAAERLRESVGHALLESHAAEYERGLSRLRAALDAETLDAAWLAGRLLPLDKAYEMALQVLAST